MPVTCESCPSTSARARGVHALSDHAGWSACGSLMRKSRKRRMPSSNATVGRSQTGRASSDRRCGIRCTRARVPRAGPPRRHPGHAPLMRRLIDRHRRSRRKVQRAAERRVGHDAEHSVDGIIHVHEIDEIPAVATDRELAPAGHDGAQPTRGDLARRFVRTVCAKETDIRVAGQGPPPFAKKGQIALRRQFRDGRYGSIGFRRFAASPGLRARRIRRPTTHTRSIGPPPFQEIDERHSIRLEIQARVLGRRRRIAVGGQIQHGVGSTHPRRDAGDGIAIEEIAGNGRDIGQSVFRNERRQIGPV